MNKFIKLTLISLFAFGTISTPTQNYFISNSAQAQTRKIAMAVLDFENNSGVKEWDYMRKGIPRVIVANLAKNKGLQILEREKLDKALTELKFAQSGFVSPDTARKLGKITGADYALYGSITKFGSSSNMLGSKKTIIVDATIIDIQTGEVKFVESIRGNDENEIINLVDKLSVMILNDLLPEEFLTKNPQVNSQIITSNKQTNNDPKIVFVSSSENSKIKQVYISTTSGALTKITSTKTNNYSPVWSPDGNRIAYVNDKFGVTIFDLKENTTTQFSENPVYDVNPKWSPDSSKVIFMTEEKKGYSLYIASKEGTMQKMLSPVGVDVKDFDVSPYGVIAFSGKVNKNWQLFIMDLAGNNIQQLTKEGNNFSPSWSPDGTKLAFVSDREDYEKIYLMNSNGSSQSVLTKGDFDEEKPLWSPDGNKIAFTTIKKNKGKVSVVNTDGSGQKILTNDDLDYYDITWIKGTDEIGFTNNGVIYSMSPSGGFKKELILPVEGIEEPKWK